MNTNSLILRLFNKSGKIYKYNNLPRSRQLAKLMSTNVSISQMGKEKDSFQDLLPGIIDSLVTNPKFAQIPEVGSWVKKMLDYNLIGGKKTRGLTTVFAYEMLEKPENITEGSLRLARTLGWCVEMLQAYLLVVDDIMDGSSTRRGMPCWYRMPNVGLGAINDSILIYCSIFETLNAHFGKTQYYVDVLDLFNETLLYTSMGQHLDYSMAHRNKNDYSLFTIERYNSIVEHKTAYYTYKLPIFLGLLLANNTDKKTHKEIETICLELGNLFQIQDDYIDCFGDEKVTGKAGTDIQEGKCSWLAVNALQRCNEAQRNEFVECYASKHPAHVERIKQLYNQLELPQLYKEQERVIYDGIVQRANALPVNASPALFLKLLEITYNRKQ